MGCLALIVNCASFILEEMGLYEPEIDLQEAKDRLIREKSCWEQFQGKENNRGTAFEKNYEGILPPPAFVQNAIAHLKSHKIEQGIAVDLGCGVNPKTLSLLEQGWKVYAVDHSDAILQALKEKVSSLGKDWIEKGQLVLICQSIETFEYPENVHLIVATESLSYCDPERIQELFLRAKNALLSQGMFVGNLFPYADLDIANKMLRAIGGWMTTKNVIHAITRSVDFPSWTVIDGKSPMGIADQFQVFAENGAHDPQDFEDLCRLQPLLRL